MNEVFLALRGDGDYEVLPTSLHVAQSGRFKARWVEKSRTMKRLVNA